MKFLKYLDVRQFTRTNRYYFLFNIVLGLWTLFFFVITRDTPLQQPFINSLFDKVIEWRSGIWELNNECDAKIASQDVVMLSFDDEAIRYLRRPYILPRNKIADMIRYAYEGGASVIVLDIALSEADHSPASKRLGDSAPMTGQERDKELFNLLEKIKNDTASNTRVLIYTDQEMEDNEFATLIDNRKIYLAIPEVAVSLESNRRVRFWVPYSVITEEDDEVETQKVLWSFQVLTLALVEGGEEELERISQEILHGDNEKFTMHCKSGRDFVFYREIPLNDDVIIRDTNTLQYNRIQYVFTPQKWNMRTIDANHIGYWSDISLDDTKIDFTNKVVVIGREDKECDDFFSTLIGRMAGMYVQGNAIATVLGKTQPHISPLWKYILIEVILIIVTAYVFVYFQFSGAKRFSCVLAFICCIGSYLYFWLTNEFVYLTCSFASMGIYNFVSRMEKFFKRKSTFKSYLKKIFRRKSNKEHVNLEK